MKFNMLIVGVVMIICFSGISPVLARGGDQILDGIGETGLIARYLFNGDAREWSRNNLHGTIQGSDFRFVPDSLFGNVLSLQEDGETYISIPGRAVAGEESLSISGWIFMRSAISGQMFLDFGKDGKSHFFAAPAGTKDKEGFQVQIVTESARHSAGAPAVHANQHIPQIIGAL